MMSAVSAANAVQRFNGYSNLTGKCAANVLGGGRNGGNVFIKRAWPARFTICELRNELLSFRVATVALTA